MPVKEDFLILDNRSVLIVPVALMLTIVVSATLRLEKRNQRSLPEKKTKFSEWKKRSQIGFNNVL